MPETRFAEMAGTGIIKTGTTFSINPVQRLRVVTVTDRLTVPEETDQPDSAASISYVNNAFNRSGRLKAGAGLTVSSDSTVSVASRQTFDKVTLSGIQEASTDATNVAFVRNAVAQYKQTVDAALAQLRDKFAEKKFVTDAITELCTRAFVEAKVQNLATVTHLNDAVKLLVNQTQLKEVTNRLASTAYVQENVSNLTKATKQYTDEAVANKADISHVERLAETSAEYTDRAIAGLATQKYVEDKMSGLATETDLQNIISTFAPLEYVDQAVSGFASTGYVDAALAERLPRPITPSVQYVKPANASNIHINNDTSYLLIDADTPLMSITVIFPDNAGDGSIVHIATSIDIDSLILQGVTMAGDIKVPESLTLTTGSSLRFLYSGEAKRWFVL